MRRSGRTALAAWIAAGLAKAFGPDLLMGWLFGWLAAANGLGPWLVGFCAALGAMLRLILAGLPPPSPNLDLDCAFGRRVYACCIACYFGVPLATGTLAGALLKVAGQPDWSAALGGSLAALLLPLQAGWRPIRHWYRKQRGTERETE